MGRPITHSAARRNDKIGPMLAQQDTLPHLPVPTIESTAFRYMETVRPHLNFEQFQHSQTAIREFLDSPMVKKLQDRLQDRAAQPGMKNWLSDWWNLVAYMGYRDPVVVFVSYYYVHVMNFGKFWREGDSPSLKAALMLKGILTFRHLVETYVPTALLSTVLTCSHSQQLTPDKVKDKALCMDSYKWLWDF
jgi:carnitine O-acetyltransferase